MLKPNVEVLHSILDGQGCEPEESVYLGDSLMKDIVMAQAAGVLDAHAEYGLVQHRDEYDLLRRVTHWTDEDVAREKALATPTVVRPTVVCHNGFPRRPAPLRTGPCRCPLTEPATAPDANDDGETTGPTMG